MPLTKVGARTLAGFRKRYGDKAEEVFYASMNKGTLDASKMEQKSGSIRKRQAKEKK
jgi:hypothetical protein